MQDAPPVAAEQRTYRCFSQLKGWTSGPALTRSDPSCVRVAWVVAEAPRFLRGGKATWVKPCAGAWPSGLTCASRRCAQRDEPYAVEKYCVDCGYGVCGDCACHSGYGHESAAGTCRCWFGNFGYGYHTQEPAPYFGGSGGGPAYVGPFVSEAQRGAEDATLRNFFADEDRGPGRGAAWYQPTQCAREGCARWPTLRCARCKVTPYCSKHCQKRAWVEADVYGKTHRELCGPHVSYKRLAARRVPGAVGDASPGDREERFRAALGRYPLEDGYVFAGRRVPPLRDLCARALPVGAEIPPTELEVSHGRKEVVTRIEAFHRVREEAGFGIEKSYTTRVRVFESAAAAAAAAAVAGTEEAPTPEEFSYDYDQEIRAGK